ncbi:SDR family NAD(P)-dependent oxidoreductase [Bradyrhizobium sp. JYMT SZCCT0428]|uniref:SDR family NAD(P)-dependent oxidoreductase n=1 Tax=Bradyrhizobium sp. JYMT SZCCT0428 TaxID=2807673 RepID=UPI001BA7B97D|nr:SDR family NAD(P)-dependent oxidoreductase [Bradyrhizobium sp. JYMT SZCCT0428]MBR1149427.1 SDR family oxidoreductase [Bradyrhizobium sp. JYMT SZCCT0428]
MRKLDNQVAIITGGARGQGAEEARRFALEGAAVAICDVLETEGNRLAAEISAAGGHARFFPLDVSSEQRWQTIVSEVVEWRDKITILVNNAGIINQLGVLETSIDEWNRVMNVNITGPFLGIKHVAPIMGRAGGGSIINIASTASHLGVKCAAYVSSKTGLLGLTRTAATELADLGVRVNAICPGVVATDMGSGLSSAEAMRVATPMLRHGTVDDVARLALFLASNDSDYITGTEITIDGGFVAAGAMKLVRHLVNNPKALDVLKAAGL